MKVDLLKELVCPSCKSSFTLHGSSLEGKEVMLGTLDCARGHSFKVARGVPRFVSQRYAASFGEEWNRNRLTQHDSRTKAGVFARRFHSYTGWTAEELKGKAALEVGCGAGPFVELCSAAGAEVFAVDLSDAVDACFETHGRRENVHVVMADANNLPFPEAVFDYVYSIGVLHHTPDPRRSFRNIQRHVRPGGKVAIWVYRRAPLGIKSPRWLVRQYLFNHLPPATTYRLVERMVPLLLPVKRFVSRIPVLGKVLRPFLLVADYDGVYKLSEEDLLRWSILDTFDGLTPKYVSEHTPEEVRGWFEECGLCNIRENNPVVGEESQYKGFSFLRKSIWGIALSAERP